jgi:hypothetical protein
MQAPYRHSAPDHRLRATLNDPHVRVGLLAAAALLVEAVLAKSVLDLQLNFFAQLAALWVFVAYKLSGRRDRLTETAASVAVVVVTATVLIVYAL